MDDLLKRLRHGVEWLRGSRYNGSADLMQEAADEIDRLRAELADAVTAIPQAVRNERERCAALCLSRSANGNYRADTREDCAALIRGEWD